jgi:energy-coupling factor transporter ATP-binding protein EcfA2
MLIDFTVENFRSFAEAQTFSMIASKDSSHEQNVVQQGPFRLLKLAALFGANASGKSNLIKAFAFMNGFVQESATKMNLGDRIWGIEPFRLDREWPAKPSTFAVRLLLNGTEYQYGFSATQERIHKEWLHLKREGGRVTPALLRQYDDAAGTTNWHMRGELKEQASAAEKATRDNGLFLSQAAQMNVELVKELFLWFRGHFWCLDLSTPPTQFVQLTARRVSENQSFHARVERLVHDADLGIGKLEANKHATFAGAPKEPRELLPRAEHYEVRTLHSVHGLEEPVEFSLERDESLGTQRFFAIAGIIVLALDKGGLLVVDELDCSTHPLLTQKVVELFQSNDANENGAQLLFATHDSSLISPSLLRRDQIWFSDKNDKAATQLFSLSDIEAKPRKHEAFAKNYLAGRYGAVPSFGPSLENYEWATNETYELLTLLPGSGEALMDISAVPEHLRDELERCVYHKFAETSNPLVDDAERRARHPPSGAKATPPSYCNLEKIGTSVRRTKDGDAYLLEES